MDTFSPEKRSSIMASVLSKDTAPELIVRGLVFALGYRYRVHVKELPGKPDLVFSRRRRVILVHGCFWHRHRCRRAGIPLTNTAFWEAKLTRNKERDRRTARLLSAQGWKVLTVWQCQTKNQAALQKRIAEFLGPLRQKAENRELS